MRRASGTAKPVGVHALPGATGRLPSHPQPLYGRWAAAVLAFAFLWAFTLLTYLLPPAEIYGNLSNGTLTRNQTVFLGVGHPPAVIEFMFARHLFCRFACAVGLFQSLAWMGNDQAMVVGFDRRRAAACSRCNNACDNVCPMRLQSAHHQAQDVHLHRVRPMHLGLPARCRAGDRPEPRTAALGRGR